MTDLLDFSFPKSSRLLDSKSYSAVFNNAQKIGGRFLLLLYRETDRLSPPRLGIIVAKKNVRRAVARNRIKRLVRESFRLHQHQLMACDIVVLAMKGVDTLTNAEIVVELGKKWQRLVKSS